MFFIYDKQSNLNSESNDLDFNTIIQIELFNWNWTGIEQSSDWNWYFNSIKVSELTNNHSGFSQ